MEKLENQVIKNISSNNRSYKSMNVDCNVCLRSFVFFSISNWIRFSPYFICTLWIENSSFFLSIQTGNHLKIGMSCFIMGKSVFPQRLFLLVFQFRNVKLKVYRNTDRNEVGKKSVWIVFSCVHYAFQSFSRVNNNMRTRKKIQSIFSRAYFASIELMVKDYSWQMTAVIIAAIINTFKRIVPSWNYTMYAIIWLLPPNWWHQSYQ